MENGIKVGDLDSRKCEQKKKGTGTWSEVSGITGPIRERKGSWEGSDRDENWEKMGGNLERSGGNWERRWELGEKGWELGEKRMGTGTERVGTGRE